MPVGCGAHGITADSVCREVTVLCSPRPPQPSSSPGDSGSFAKVGPD